MSKKLGGYLFIFQSPRCTDILLGFIKANLSIQKEKSATRYRNQAHTFHPSIQNLGYGDTQFNPGTQDYVVCGSL